MMISCSSVLANSPGLVFWKSESSEYLGCNDNLCSFLDLKSSNKILGQKDIDLPWRRFADSYLSIDQEVLMDESISIIQEIISSEYERYISITHKSPIYSKENKVKGIIGNSFIVNSAKTLSKINRSGLLRKASTLVEGSKAYIKQKFKGLSQQESICMFHMLRADSNKLIAKKMGLSNRTVEGYIDNIKKKFFCNSRADIIAYAFDLGYQYVVPKKLLLKMGIF